MNVKHAFIAWLGGALLAFPVALTTFFLPPWATLVVGAIVVTVYGWATLDYVFPRWVADIWCGWRRAREVEHRLRSVMDLACECQNPERLQYRGRDGRTHCEQCDGLIAPSEQEEQ